MDEAASITDGLGSVDPDDTSGAQPLADWSPAIAAADVEVVPVPKQEDARERLNQAKRETKHTMPW